LECRRARCPAPGGACAEVLPLSRLRQLGPLQHGIAALDGQWDRSHNLQHLRPLRATPRTSRPGALSSHGQLAYATSAIESADSHRAGGLPPARLWQRRQPECPGRRRRLQALVAYCEYLSSLPTLTNATYGAAQCDSSGRLLVNGSGGTFPATQSGRWNVGQTGTWTVQPGNTPNTSPWLVTVSTALPAGTKRLRLKQILYDSLKLLAVHLEAFFSTHGSGSASNRGSHAHSSAPVDPDPQRVHLRLALQAPHPCAFARMGGNPAGAFAFASFVETLSAPRS
jgi:hypothetical protein